MSVFTARFDEPYRVDVLGRRIGDPEKFGGLVYRGHNSAVRVPRHLQNGNVYNHDGQERVSVHGIQPVSELLWAGRWEFRTSGVEWRDGGGIEKKEENLRRPPCS